VKDRIGFADAIDGWTQEQCGGPGDRARGIYGQRAEERLTRAGLFIPWVLGIELIEELLFRAQRYAAGHQVLTDELEAMLDTQEPSGGPSRYTSMLTRTWRR